MAATISIKDIYSDIQQSVLEIIELYPLSLVSLKTWTSEQWVQFFRLVSNGKCSLDNIALQLFLDVLKWHSCDTVYAMQYRIYVKRFGAVGYKLFKEKIHLIHGVGGGVGGGALNCWNNWQMVTKMRGSWDPCKSRINFVTPFVTVRW